MSYYDDELERGRNGRDGKPEMPRRSSAGQRAGGTSERAQSQNPIRRQTSPDGLNQTPRPVRRQTAGQPSGRMPSQTPEGVRRQAVGGQAPEGVRRSQPGGQAPEGVRRQAVGGQAPEGVRRSQPGGQAPEGVRRSQPGGQAPEGVRRSQPGGQVPEGTRRPVQGAQNVRGVRENESSRQTARSMGSQESGRGRVPSGGKAASNQGSSSHQGSRVSGGPKLNGNGTEDLRRRDSSGGRITATSQAAKKQAEKTAKNRKKRRLITLAVAECIALVFIFTYAFFARKWSLMVQPSDWDAKDVTNPVFSVEVPEYMKGHWTFAVFGVDSRDKNVLKGTNSDVIMICDVNQDTGEIKLVSVFRDTYLSLDDKGTYNKINQAYFVGGPTQAVKALNKNLDLNITDYVTFNWNAVANGINALGGIDMNISKAEFYYINSFITETVKGTGIGSHQLTHAGENHLDGVQAVAYGRLRLMDTDYARTERQRKVIKAAFDKAVKADLTTLNSLVGAVLPQVSTCIDVNDIFGMLKNVSKYHIGDTMGFPAARGEASIPKKGACVIPQTLESNVIALHEFLFGEENYVPSSTVKEISAKIASDTGMYKAGTAIKNVPTDNGVIPSSKSPAKTTEETDETSSSAPTFETDEEGNFYDEEGNLVDEEGRRIDEYGFLIDEEGRRIDEDGNLLEEPGETDVDGNPIIDGETEDENGRPLTPISPTESSPSGTIRPGESTGAARPTAPNSTAPTAPTAPTRPISPGAEETTEGVGPGTGLEPGGSGGSNGSGIIDNSTSGPSSGNNVSGGEPGGGQSGPSTITPVPTENYDNIGPGM